MIVLVSSLPEGVEELLEGFGKYGDPSQYCLPDDPRAQHATTAACWFPDAKVLASLPNLKLVHSIAAGVEHLNIAQLGSDYTYCRVVDSEHKLGMFEYLLWSVLYFQRNFDIAKENQSRMQWQHYNKHEAKNFKITILGLGEMGGYVGQRLAQFGYAISGWSNSPKNIEGITSYTGKDDLISLLANTDLLINLLPLTDKTHGILNKDFLKQLPKGSALINCGRGQHLDEDALIELLDSGHLRGAILDVFSTEPLENKAIWQHPKIIATPHIASHAPWSAVAAQIIENAKRLDEGKALMNVVDLNKGY